MDSEKVKNIYNEKIRNCDSYEKKRWFQNSIRRAGYKMTLNALKRHVFEVNFGHCLELGPGHGTWTEKLIQTHQSSKFDLVDISEEMLALSQKRFEDLDNIRYFRSNFLEFEADQKYDFFFSSRVIEYLPQKELVVKKIVDLLEDEKEGFIITKTPKYLRAKLLKRKVSDFHSGQISPQDLVNLFKQNNCKVDVYPVTLSFPVLHSAKINLFLAKIFSNKKLNFISQFFSESYGIKFKKQ